MFSQPHLRFQCLSSPLTEPHDAQVPVQVQGLADSEQTQTKAGSPARLKRLMSASTGADRMDAATNKRALQHAFQGAAHPKNSACSLSRQRLAAVPMPFPDGRGQRLWQPLGLPLLPCVLHVIRVAGGPCCLAEFRAALL